MVPKKNTDEEKTEEDDEMIAYLKFLLEICTKVY